MRPYFILLAFLLGLASFVTESYNGQYVDNGLRGCDGCRNAGTMPDFRPQPQADGTLNTYKINDSDGCVDIETALCLQQQDIEDFNNTWGWVGCAYLQSGQLICLNRGTPLMRSPIQGVSCGPQVRIAGAKYAAPCTATGGCISITETTYIIMNRGNYSIVKSYAEKDSDPKILMHGNPRAVDWVAYMDGDLKAKRINVVIGGLTDWNVNLQTYSNNGAVCGGGSGRYLHYRLSQIRGIVDRHLDEAYHEADNIANNQVNFEFDNEFNNEADNNADNNADKKASEETSDEPDEDPEDDSDDEPDSEPDSEANEDLTCSANQNPGTLDGLADKADSLDPGCVKLFALDILYSQLVDSLSLFQTNLEGYDDKFRSYEKWTKERIQPRIDDFMRLGEGKGLKYFDCYWAYTGSSETKDTCLGMPHIWDMNDGWSIRYELVDRTGFFDALAAETGIDESWVTFGEKLDYTCADSGNILSRTGHKPCRRLNYPQKGSNDKVNVGDPKKLVEAAMTNVTALRTSLLATYLSVGLSYYEDGPEKRSAIDAVVAYSMPVLQLAEAVSSMKYIREIVEGQEKKDFLLSNIVSMARPFVSEALGPLVGSTASIARIPILLGKAGNGALTAAADIIEDPASAPFAILGLIAGVGGGTGTLSKGEALAEASKARRLMKATDLAKFPQGFRHQDASVQRIVQSLCEREREGEWYGQKTSRYWELDLDCLNSPSSCRFIFAGLRRQRDEDQVQQPEIQRNMSVIQF